MPEQLCDNLRVLWGGCVEHAPAHQDKFSVRIAPLPVSAEAWGLRRWQLSYSPLSSLRDLVPDVLPRPAAQNINY